MPPLSLRYVFCIWHKFVQPKTKGIQTFFSFPFVLSCRNVYFFFSFLSLPRLNRHPPKFLNQTTHTFFFEIESNRIKKKGNQRCRVAKNIRIIHIGFAWSTDRFWVVVTWDHSNSYTIVKKSTSLSAVL